MLDRRGDPAVRRHGQCGGLCLARPDAARPRHSRRLRSAQIGQRAGATRRTGIAADGGLTAPVSRAMDPFVSLPVAASVVMVIPLWRIYDRAGLAPPLSL